MKQPNKVLYLKLITGDEIIATCRYAGLHCFLLELPLRVIFTMRPDEGALKLTPWIPTLDSLRESFCFDIPKSSVLTAVEAPLELRTYYHDSLKGYLDPDATFKTETSSSETSH